MKVKKTGVTKKGIPFTSYKIYVDVGLIWNKDGYRRLNAKPTGHTKSFYIFDYGTDILWFVMRNYNSKTKYGDDVLKGFLKFKNGRFTFYTKRSGLRNRSNSAVCIDSFLPTSDPKKLSKNNIYVKRFHRVLKQFAKRHGVTLPNNLPVHRISPLIQYLCYPGLRKFYNQISDGNIHPDLSRHLRKDQDFKFVIKRFFGSKGDKITKLVYKRILEDKNLNILFLGKVLKGIIPLDYFFKLLEKGIRLSSFRPTEINKLRFLLKNYSPERVIKLLERNDIRLGGEPYSIDYLFTDSAEIYFKHHKDIELPKSPKNINELHDYLALEQRKLRHKNMQIKLAEVIQKIDGKKVDDLEIEVAKDTHTLVHWGKKMKHCIGSYGDRALNGDYVLLGLKRDGELVYNISIYRKSIDQFKGFANRYPDPEDQKKVINFLKENNLITQNTTTEYRF